MKNDPFVEEIHDIRERFLQECHGDLQRLLDRYQHAESKDKERLASFDSIAGKYKDSKTTS